MSTQGTIKPFPEFNPQDDAKALKNAMKGFGCNDKGVIEILCRRSNQQRQQIIQSFKQAYGKDLIKTLIDELRGNFEDLIVALCYPPTDFDARELRNAMKGAGTDEPTLIEIMTSRGNKEIRDIKTAYERMYKRDLERDLASETSGVFKRLMVSLSMGARDETGETDLGRATQDAEALLQAGVKKLGTDESTFNAILASNNFKQLRLVFEEYKRLSGGNSIKSAINDEFSGDIQSGLKAVISVVNNPPAYFAKRLRASMKGIGTRDSDLIRLVVSRSEIDLEQICEEYHRIYGKTLKDAVIDETSGSYKHGLVALIEGN